MQLPALTKKQKISLHKEEFEEMKEHLFKWFLNQREKKNTVTGPILKAKAKLFFSEMYPDKDEKAFTASDGWFSKLKTRHGIRFFSSDVGHSITTQISCKSRRNRVVGNANI